MVHKAFALKVKEYMEGVLQTHLYVPVDVIEKWGKKWENYTELGDYSEKYLSFSFLMNT